MMMKRKILALFMTVAMVLGGILGVVTLLDMENEPDPSPGNEYDEVSYSNLQRFNSYDEIQDFLTLQAELSGGGIYPSNISVNQVFFGERTMMDALEGGVDSDDTAGSSPDHSKTNVQEEGVDEGDIVKTDGEYAYVISKNQTKVYIIKVYPAEESGIVKVLDFDWTVRELYLNDGKLVVLGANLYYYTHYRLWMPEGYSWEPETYVNVYDITDKENPTLTREVMLKGSYVSSRTIGDYLYLIVRQYTTQVENEDDLPVAANEVYYADEYDYWYTFTTIASVNVQNPAEDPNLETILIGVSTHIYVSTENIYLTYTKRMSWVEQTERKIDEVILPMVPEETRSEIQDIQNSGGSRLTRVGKIDEVVGEYADSLSDTEKMDFYNDVEVQNNVFLERLAPQIQKTMIHRIRINNGWIQYEASGGVLGYVLNRFSMSEYNQYFRIATTSGQRWWWGSADNSLNNHVFVCDLNLNVLGGVSDIAPGESIYSARFVRDRGYLVTFVVIDPFFVIDLSNPKDPEIMGELKIPGYSNYLHPYDDDHVIGIGKDAIDEGDFAWYLGVKLSLFDVTDVENPKEKSKYIVGDRGTESLALSDPHAFLFAKSKDLLVMPIVLAEIDESEYPGEIPPSAYGDTVWCGAYVFSVDDVNGFQLQGEVTHLEDYEEPDPDGYWYYPFWNKRIKRTFYIENVLYTLSDYLIQANSLDDFEEISSVTLTD
jgi:uncharacterized secreted protein with C-terminal beta-propeller domain